MIKKLIVLCSIFFTVSMVQADPYRTNVLNASFTLSPMPIVKAPKLKNTDGYTKTVIKKKLNKLNVCEEIK